MSWRDGPAVRRCDASGGGGAVTGRVQGWAQGWARGWAQGWAQGWGPVRCTLAALAHLVGLAARRSREADTLTRWEGLKALTAEKQPFLEDHLGRNEFQDKVRRWVRTHEDGYGSVSRWVDEKKAYLQARESIGDIQAAMLHLALLNRFRQDQAEQLKSNVAALQALGKTIRSAVYQTAISQWTYEQPGEVQQLEDNVTGAFWTELDQLAAAKQTVLDDHLAREQFKEKVRLWVRSHTSKSAAVERWCAEKLAYLNTKEVITDSRDALVQLSILEPFEVDKQAIEDTSVAALLTLGMEIRDAEYKTTHSSWAYERPEEVKALEDAIRDRLDELAVKAAAKKRVLDDDLARELFKEKVRLWVKGHASRHAELTNWCQEKTAYLETKEVVCKSVPAAWRTACRPDRLLPPPPSPWDLRSGCVPVSGR